MKIHPVLGLLLAMLLATFLLFRLFQNEIVDQLFNFGTQPELEAILSDAGRDLRQLAQFDPQQADAYRERFQKIQEMRKTINVLRNTKPAIVAQFESALMLLFALLGLFSLAYHFLSHRFRSARLRQLREPLVQLARGNGQVQVPLAKQGLIGEMAKMIEETSRVISTQRNKIHYLRNLQDWQEATRRQVHEINKPLTAARLELDRLHGLLTKAQPEPAAIETCRQSVDEELTHLSQYLRDATAFAKMGKPKLEPLELSAYLANFCNKFQPVWPRLDLKFLSSDAPMVVQADPYMTRQVLMNLCTNSAQALDATQRGSIQMSLHQAGQHIYIDIADNGPGIHPDICDRLFQPYASTRHQGQGMGLGLAISKKIMLEQGGDLELHASTAAGATFRMSFSTIQNQKE